MKFKKLNWIKGEVAEDGTYVVWAQSASRYDLSICHQNGEFFASWSMEAPNTSLE